MLNRRSIACGFPPRALCKTGCECRPSGPGRAVSTGSTGRNLSGFLHNANFCISLLVSIFCYFGLAAWHGVGGGAAQSWGWSYGELVGVRFWLGREGVVVARVVCIHGVGQQLKGEDSLAGEWALALRDGMRRAGCAESRLPEVGEIRCVFYGDVFRPAGRRLAVGDPWLTASDATEFDQELLATWWRGAAQSDPRVVDPDARTLARTPGGVQAALRALTAWCAIRLLGHSGYLRRVGPGNVSGRAERS